MEKKQKILELRERLDRTLTSPVLSKEESVKSLVKNQLLCSSFSGTEGNLANVVQKRAAEVSNFLEMLRSVSGNDKESLMSHGALHTSWKLKQDTDQLRVMYREGPQGTPFHTLLAEGYADGPIDVCLCVSWEAALYKKWWPQYRIPTFKIIMSSCLQKIRTGEEISLVRVKVPWPMTDREAVLHNFELEYFEEDLLLVLLNTVPDKENIDLSTHGFTNDGIPEAKDTVQIDLVGGFVLQKVSPSRSYFRAIANMDIKLDFVPPSLINFISRQLIGNGHKLYQKALASATSDEDYRLALKRPMYARIREGLDHSNKPKIVPADVKDEEKSTTSLAKECEDGNASANTPAMINTLLTSEIEEEESEQDLYLEGIQLTNATPTNLATEQQHARIISPEVEHALSILDMAITIVRDLGSSNSNGSSPDVELQTSDTTGEAACLGERDDQEKSAMDNSSGKVEGSSVVETFRDSEEDHITRQVANHEQQSTSLPNESNSVLVNGEEDKSRGPSYEERTGAAATAAHTLTLDHMSKVFDEVSAEANGTPHGSGRYQLNDKRNKKKKRKQRLCCLSFR